MDGLRGRLAQEASIDNRVAAAAFSALGRTIGEDAWEAFRHIISQRLGDADRALFDRPRDFEETVSGMMGEAAPLVLSTINAGLAREFGLDGQTGTLADIIEEIMVRHG
jgi:hypothetical protein